MRVLIRCGHCVRTLVPDVGVKGVAEVYECECGTRYTITMKVETPQKEAQNGTTPVDNID